jgi:hypothetical protein
MQGTVAIAVIAGAQAGNAWLTHWGHGFDHLLEGKPTPIVRNGRLLDDGIRKERMNVKDVMAHLREQGITDVREVKAAFVEDPGPSGAGGDEPRLSRDLDLGRVTSIFPTREAAALNQPVGKGEVAS